MLFLKKTNQLLDTKESKDFKQLLTFFNYYISNIVLGQYLKEPAYMIWIERVFTENIKKRCSNFYHVTDISNLESIMHKGLIAKQGKSKQDVGYRYFTDRIFLIMDSPDIKSDLQKIIALKKIYINTYYFKNRIRTSSYKYIS